MRAQVVINPISGPRRSRPVEALAEAARAVLGAAGFEVAVTVTRAPGDARTSALAARASGVERVVAWGGDGTINEVASALAFSEVVLAVVPGGSGNGLARELGVPLDLTRALAVAAHGTRRLIDAGEMDGRLFFNIAGIGLDAAVAHAIAEPDARRGLTGYIRLAVREGLGYRAGRYSIVVGGERREHHALVLALANSRQYGNQAIIAPRARLDDGRLDLVVVEDQPLWRIAGQLRALFRGTLEPGPRLSMTPFTELAIEADEPIAYHVDGEPGRGGRRITVSARPRALWLCVP